MAKKLWLLSLALGAVNLVLLGRMNGSDGSLRTYCLIEGILCAMGILCVILTKRLRFLLTALPLHAAIAVLVLLVFWST